jgi:glycosyltransferase involved in cell wall biosynthesis
MSRHQRRLRVLQIIGSLHIGGAENVVVNLARRLDAERFDVRVGCTRERGVLAERLASEGVDVRLVAPKRRQLRHATPLVLLAAIWRTRPDIIHTHGVPAMLHTGPLAALRLLPTWVHTFHFGNYAAGLTREMEMERRLCRRASHLLAVSETQRRTLLEHYALSPDAIGTIVNGVDPNPTALDPAHRAAMRAALGLAPDDVVVGTVAVLSEQKGITYLLQAAPRILGHDPRVRLLIVGGGPYEAALRAEADALGMGNRIVFTGWRADGAALLPALDVFVMASLWEAMPMVLLETMAAGRPIVVTDVGENRAIVEDGRCGRVIAKRDPGGIADAVCALLARPEEAAAMGRRARSRFEDRFTTAQMAGSHAELYERLARRRSAG